MFFSICTARKKLAWLRVQSLMKALTSSLPASRSCDARCDEQIVEFQAHAGNPVSPCGTGAAHRRCGSAPDRCRTRTCRPRTRRRRGRSSGAAPHQPASPPPAGRSSVTPVADENAKRARQFGTEDDVEAIRQQGVEFDHFSCAAGNRRPGLLRSGRMPRTTAPRTASSVSQHSLRLHERRRGEDLRLFGSHRLATLFPTDHLAADAGNLDVRDDSKNACPQFGLENRSLPTGRRSAPPPRGRCRTSKSAR
jgi:hypothetical protein